MKLKAFHAGWPEPPDIRHSKALFRKSISLYHPGKFQVRVFSLKGDLLAQTEIMATQEPCHPWMPLDPCYSVDKDEQAEDNGEYDAIAYAQNRASGIAIPRFDGMMPSFVPGTAPGAKAKSLAGEHLPTLIPEKAGNMLTVKANGTDLIIESQKEIILARPDWHFLTRWWVNGKPYIPTQMEAFSDQNGMVAVGKRLLLHLKFDPQRVGAKQGDQVELQLLYCLNGWELVLFAREMEMMAALLDEESPELLLSNRTRIHWEKDGNTTKESKP